MSNTPSHQMTAAMPQPSQYQFGAATAAPPFTLPYKYHHPVKNPLTSAIQHGWGDTPWGDHEEHPMLTHLGTKHQGKPVAQAALSRLRHLSNLVAGWDGTDVAAPRPDAIKDAMALAVQLVHAGVQLKPVIGLDDDGAVSFLFVRDGLPLADLTVAGDGTYSFFAEWRQHVAKRDAARIGWPIPRDLLRILAD